MDAHLLISFGLVSLVWVMGYISGRFDAAVKYVQVKNEKSVDLPDKR
jgi:hypothetical protein